MNDSAQIPLASVATSSTTIHLADGEMPSISIGTVLDRHSVSIDYRGGQVILFIDGSLGLADILSMLSRPKVG